MKKTLLALTLSLAIYGCSDENKTSNNTNKSATPSQNMIQQDAKIADKIAALEVNYSEATVTFLNNYINYTGLYDIDYTIDMAEDGKDAASTEYISINLKQKEALVNIIANSKSQVDLSKYNSKDGKAIFNGTADYMYEVAVPSENLTFKISPFFNGTRYESVLDEKHKSLIGNYSLKDNTSNVLLNDEIIAEIKVAEAKGESSALFKDNYTSLTSFKTSDEIKKLSFNFVGPLTAVINVALTVDHLKNSVEYDAKPFKYIMDSSGKFIVIDFTHPETTQQYHFDIASIDGQAKLLEKDQQYTISNGLSIEGITAQIDNKEKINYGDFSYDINTTGINKINNFNAIVEKLNQIGTNTAVYIPTEEDINMFYSAFSEALSKDLHIEMNIKSQVADTKDSASFSFSIQPSAELIEQAKLGSESFNQYLQNLNSPAEIFDKNIKELKINVSIDNKYLITQYENSLKLQGKDASKAKAELSVGLAAIPLMNMEFKQSGVDFDLIKADKGTLSFNATFKDGVWTINDKTTTTEELMGLFAMAALFM